MGTGMRKRDGMGWDGWNEWVWKSDEKEKVVKEKAQKEKRRKEGRES